MSRELRFRAWHKKRRKFYEVLHLHLSVMKSEGIWATCKGRDCIAVQDIPIKIAPKDVYVMQYTGLKDKNGVEIYEGDVIRYTSKWLENPRDFIVQFFNGAWQQKEINHHNESLDIWIAWKVVEIIGNIYENPKLLERN